MLILKVLVFALSLIANSVNLEICKGDSCYNKANKEDIIY